MTHGNVKGQWVKNETAANIKVQIAKLKQQVKYCQDKINWYKEELEHKKQEVPLGVPLQGTLNGMPPEAVVKNFIEIFSSEESADEFENYLNDFVKALQDIAKGEPIDIRVLLPLLKKGYVAMDSDKKWYWYPEKPHHAYRADVWSIFAPNYSLGGFNIKPAKNWETSLMECGL